MYHVELLLTLSVTCTVSPAYRPCGDGGILYSSDGTFMAVASPKNVLVYDTSTHQVVCTIVSIPYQLSTESSSCMTYTQNVTQGL